MKKIYKYIIHIFTCFFVQDLSYIYYCIYRTCRNKIFAALLSRAIGAFHASYFCSCFIIPAVFLHYKYKYDGLLLLVVVCALYLLIKAIITGFLDGLVCYKEKSLGSQIPYIQLLFTALFFIVSPIALCIVPFFCWAAH